MNFAKMASRGRSRSASALALMARHRGLAALALLPLATCGGNDATGPGASADPVPAAISAAAGNGQQGTAGSALTDSIVVVVSDAGGRPVPNVSVSWSVTGGGGSVSPSSSGTDGAGRARTRWTLGAAAGSNTLSAKVGSLPALSFTATGVPGQPSSIVRVSEAELEGVAGAAVADPVVVRVRDSGGNAVSGVTVTWTITEGEGSAGPETSVTGGNGEASTQWTLGTTAGQNELRASAGGSAAATFKAVAAPGPAATVSVSPPDAVINAGGQVAFAASADDEYGNPIEDAAFDWSSSDEAVATVDGDGVVTGHAQGSADIGAAIGSVEGSAGLIVTTAAPLAIESDGAMVRLTRESTAALEASGGIPPFEWSLLAGSMPAGLALAADGAITGTATSLGSSAVTVRVRDSENVTAQADVTIDVCEAPLDLAVGEAVVWSFPHSCGVLLAESDGARYRVGVTGLAYQTSGATVSSISGGLRLEREASDGAGLDGIAAQAAFQAHPHGVDDAFDAETRALIRRTEEVHLRLRAEELSRIGTGRAGHLLGPPNADLKRMAMQYDPPENRTFTAENPNASGRITIDATLRGMSDEIIYYQDNTVIGTGELASDAQVQAVLDYYADHGLPVIDEVFGGLGPDGTTNIFPDGPREAADIDGNGRFIVLQLHSSNMIGGAAAYVHSLDRFPTSQYPTSNEAEITYMLNPNSDFYLATVVHEAKHIASHGYAIFGGRGYNPSWIEEGTAEIAKELSSRRAAGFDYREELEFLDLYPSGGGTPPRATYGMAVVHDRARSFLRAAPANGLIGNPSPNSANSTYYGSSWLFHRYLADAYAGSDVAGFFRAMNTGGTGIGRIEQATGRGFGELVSEFLLAISVEGQAGARAAAPYRFGSYDFAGIAAPFSGSWPYLQGSAAFSGGTSSLSTYYTATNFFDLTGAGELSQRLDLLRSDGNPLQSSVQGVLTITRVE